MTNADTQIHEIVNVSEDRRKLLDMALKTISGLGSVAMITISVSFMDMRDTLHETTLLQGIILQNIEKLTIHQLKTDELFNLHTLTNLRDQHKVELEIQNLKRKTDGP